MLVRQVARTSLIVDEVKIEVRREPIPLLASAGATYIYPKFAAVRSVSNWGIAIQLRVWDSRRGNTFEEAWQRGRGSFGQASKVFVLNPPASNLQPPLNLVGLEPFEFGPLATFWFFLPYPANRVVIEGQSAWFLLCHAVEHVQGRYGAGTPGRQCQCGDG